MTTYLYRRRLHVPLLAAVAFLAVCSVRVESRPKAEGLRIGTTGTIGGTSGGQEKAGVETLRAFIKEETGLDSEILPQKDWQEEAEKLSKGDLKIGVMQGYEFAWAVEKFPKLKPLAVAVNVYRYPVAYVVAPRDGGAKDFADLKGKPFAVPDSGQRFLRLYLDRQCEADGKKADQFFSKITTPDNVEDALDQTVDGKLQGVVVDGSALAAYKERKPGRFKRLKEIAHSQPFPPPVIAYYEGNLDQDTMNRFQTGLLDATKKERGATLLNLFRLTGFEKAPDDLDKVLAETRKAFPPTKEAVSKK